MSDLPEASTEVVPNTDAIITAKNPVLALPRQTSPAPKLPLIDPAKLRAELEALGGTALRERFKLATGQATNSHNKPYLVKAITEAISGDATAFLARPIYGTKRKFPKRAASNKHPASAKAGKNRKHTRKRQQASGKAERRVLKSKSARVAPPWRDPRVPKAGTVLEHEYKGKQVRVKVLKDGFEYQRKHYTSLSTIAEVVAGGSVNGYAFFGLNKK